MAQLQSTVVTGNTSTTGFMSAGSRRLSMGILDLNSSGTPTQFKIKTTIPWNSGGADFTVNIKGFRYGGGQMVSLSVGWHHYNNTFYNEAAISNGGWAPVLTLAKSADNFVIIHLAGPGYWPKLYVESVYTSAYTDTYSSGWTWSDADLSDCTDISVVPYNLLATSISGNAVTTSQTNFATLTLNSATVATQTWVQSQGYLTSVSDVWVNTTGDTMTGTLTIARGQDANVTNLNINSGVTPVSAFQINSDQPNLRSILMARNGYSLVLGTQDTNRVTIDTSGNVGIGTASPTLRVQIDTTGFSLRLRETSDGSSLVMSGNQIQARTSADAGSPLYLNYTNGGNIYTGSGLVGIGTINPGAKLEVYNGDIWLNAASAGVNPEIRFVDDSGISVAGAKIRYGNNDGNLYIEHVYNEVTSGIFFRNQTAGTALNTLSLVNGKVGIQATAPIAKLQIGSSWTANPGGSANTIWLGTSGVANTNITPDVIITSNTSATTPGGTIGLALHNSNTTAGAFSPLLVFSKTETGATPYNAAIAAIGARTVTGTGASDSYIDGDLIFYTSPTAGSGLVERLRIIQNGNVGIGITNPTYKFEVSDGTRTGVFNPNSTLDGFFIGTKEAKPLILGSSDTERLRITSGGQILMGTTTTQSGARLQVAGGFLDVWSSANTLLRLRHDGTIGIIETFTSGAYSNTAINPDGGNVGVGTLTPSSKLHVVGNGLVTNSTVETTFAITSTWSNAYLNLQRADNSSISYIQFRTGATNNWQVGVPAGGAFFWMLEAGVERFRIAAGGATTFSSSVSASGLISSATEFRLNNNSYSRVAILDTNGGIAGGYNFKLSAGNVPQHDSLGAISGYYYNSNGSLALYTGSSQAANTNATPSIFIDASRNVGIGNTSPTTYGGYTVVHIGSASSVGLIKLGTGASVNGPEIFTNSTNNLYFNSDNTNTRVTILGTNGNVGIGTASPTSKLFVQGDGIIINNTTGQASYASGIKFRNDGYEHWTAGVKNSAFVIAGTGSNGDNVWAGASTADRFVITATGNVGINATGATYRLEVVADAAGLFVSGAGVSPYNQKIATFRYAGNGNDINIENQGGKAAIQARAGASVMDLILNGAGGNVAIGGITAPTNKLHIKLSDATHANEGILLQSPSGYGEGAIYHDYNQGNGQTAFKIHNTYSGAMVTLSQESYNAAGSPGSVRFYTSTSGGANTPVERARITPGGTLLFGDTVIPSESAWYATGVFGKNGTNKVIIGYLTSNTSGAVIGGHNSPLNAWADLNIAGINLIFRSSETEFMRLTSIGRLGLGTSTPQNKFDAVVSSGIAASFGGTIGVGAFSGIHFGYLEQANTNYRKSALVFERTDAYTGQGGNAGGKIHFLLNNSGATSATALTDSVVTIDSGANGAVGSVRMGIGTRNPTMTLDVVGSIRASEMYGTTYDTLTSGAGTGTAVYDTLTTSGPGAYEVVIRANPNGGGSGSYADWYIGKLVIGTGYDGAAVVHYIDFIQQTPQPRTLFGSGGGNLTVTAIFNNSGTESESATNGATYIIRFKISGYNTAYTGAGTSIYLKKIGI